MKLRSEDGVSRVVAVLRRPPKTPSITSLSGDPDRKSLGGRLTQAARTVAIFLQPKWLVFHLVVWAIAVAMVLLGRWQLDVSNSKHFDLQNFGYSLQWWAFTAFGLFIWLRVMQHHLHPPTPPVGTGLVLAQRGTGLARLGPSELVAPGTETSDQPLIYRGYVMPQSSDIPVRSHGDSYHDVYNDYLWQLSLTDKAAEAEQRPGTNTTD